MIEALLPLLANDRQFRAALTQTVQSAGESLVYGLSLSQKALFLAALYAQQPRQMVVVGEGGESLLDMRRDLAALLPRVGVYVLPRREAVTFAAAAHSREGAAVRLEVLSRLALGEPVIVLAAAEAAGQKVPSRQEFLAQRIALKIGDTINRDDLLAALVQGGYERVTQVGGIGQFSARGGIVDIFPANMTQPVRLELFGDDIDSLRIFDVLSQRSLENVQEIFVLPLRETPRQSGWASLFDYVAPQAVAVMDEPARVRDGLARVVREDPVQRPTMWAWPELLNAARQRAAVLHVALLPQKARQIAPQSVIGLTAKGVAPFHGRVDMITTELKAWQERGYAVVVLMPTAERARAVRDNLYDAAVPAVYDPSLHQAAPGRLVVGVGQLTAGFEWTHAKVVVVTEQEMFGRRKKRRFSRSAGAGKLDHFRDLQVGDYVVHVNYGIGKYAGVETLTVGGVHRDYFLIRYSGEDKLYVPTDQADLLQKYLAPDNEVPRLHKLGGTEWQKTKARAQAATKELAGELLALYAARQATPGYAFAPDTPWQREFEEAFPYEETPDQLQAIQEIKQDMEKPVPMDRLLCGDVGFGKTEVAIRAAFKAVMSGKQVAVLVPTTVLAQQHYQTFSARFAGFGPVVEVVSRFRSEREQRDILSRLAQGRIDVLIGTHRLLQPDVTFKDLGLLIVDEEQRFGVTQKERIKKWRTNVDVLTLTATPIPRTLHMSLVGARDMSIIETPPEDRLPVETYVVEYDQDIVREAIRREIRRGGQVYFVYNRVQNIESMAREIMTIMPDVRVGIAHGQMAEEQLEQVMLDFYEGRYDVLLCTTIIENGLDVPNANTLIVFDADHFGLAQLYQMRGRVGRSYRQAYAYLTYQPDKVLSEIAEKRLEAVKEFTELGSGFKIAMRDLEIRGAGNILGAQQHGHMVSVGFEMYCRLLEDAIRELRHQPAAVASEPVFELNVDAYLPEQYVDDAGQKIDIYRRIAAARDEAVLDDIADELMDRFGDMPQPVVNLLTVAKLRVLAGRLGVAAVVEKSDRITITFTNQPRVAVENILALKAAHPGRLTLVAGPPAAIYVRKTGLRPPQVLTWLGKALASAAGGQDQNLPVAAGKMNKCQQ